MGSGIAEVAAKAGVEVVLRSRKQETADAMVAGLGKSLSRQVDKGRLEASAADEVLGRVTATERPRGAAPTATSCSSRSSRTWPSRRPLFVELDGIVKDGAVLATNTSTLPVVEMAVATSRPEQVLGIHFFNPAPVMSLVEVIRTLVTSDETFAEANAFAEACGKDVRRRRGPRRLHRERPAVPVPEQRRADARERAPPTARTSTPP